MDLARTINLVSALNADPETSPDDLETLPKTVTITRTATVPESKKQAKPAKAQAAPIHNPNTSKSMTTAIALPETGTLDAKSFVLAMRNAGKRPNDNGVMLVNQQEVRNDQIKAIAGFVGYNSRRDFGQQQMAAMSKAQRELRNVKFAPEAAKPSTSVAGYVAGMPQPSRRLLADLQARERCLAEAMIDAKTGEEALAQRALLDQVQAAIHELIG